MGNLTHNFSRHEFSCKCGCGYSKIHPFLVNELQKIRNLFGKIIVGRGVSCQNHNLEIGGSQDSIHLYGLAVDVYFIDVDMDNMTEVLSLINYIDNSTSFYRIGLYSWGLHLDMFSYGDYRYWYNDNKGYHRCKNTKKLIKKYYN